eukprot:Clim_evm4s213 gene=Clim_evmTU4s213
MKISSIAAGLALATTVVAAPPRAVRGEFSERTLVVEGATYEFVLIEMYFDQPINIEFNSQQVGARTIPRDYWENFQAMQLTCDGDPYNEVLTNCPTTPEGCMSTPGCQWNDWDYSCTQEECDNGPCIVMGLPPSPRNALAEFFRSMSGLPPAEAGVLNNKLAFLVFRSVAQPGAEATQMSSYDPLTKLRQGACTISDPNGRITNASGEPVNLSTAASVLEFRNPECDQTRLNNIISQFGDVMNVLKSATDVGEMERSRWAMYSLTATDSYTGCATIIDEALVTGTAEVTVENTKCYEEEGSEAWLADVCCNYELQMTQCCAPREITALITVLDSINTSYVASACGNRGTVEGITNVIDALEVFIKVQERNADPQTGCTARFLKDLNLSEDSMDDVWDNFYDFFDTCFDAIFGTSGQGSACTQDADCYTECIIETNQQEGNCAIPWEGPAPYLRECFVDEMDDKLKKALMRLWGVYNVTDLAAFEDEFISRTGREECVGPSGWLYNGGWYQFNDPFAYNDVEFDGSGDPSGEFDESGDPSDDFDESGFDDENTILLEDDGMMGGDDMGDHGDHMMRRRTTHPLSSTIQDMKATRRRNRKSVGNKMQKRLDMAHKKRLEAHHKDLKRRMMWDDSWQDIDFSEEYCWTNSTTVATCIQYGYLWHCWGNEFEMIEQGCAYVPPDLDACVEEKACNWNWNAETEEECETDPLDNGGYFCGECWGDSDCWERSRAAKCVLNQNEDVWMSGGQWTEETCSAIGGTIFTYEWGWSDCMASGVSDSQGCIEDTCFSESGPNPDVEYGCVNPSITSDSDCWDLNDPENGIWPWFDWRWRRDGTFTQRCMIWSQDEDECDSIGGSIGFEWTQLTDDTPEARAELCQENLCFTTEINSAEDCYNLSNDPDNGMNGDWYWYDWRQNLNGGDGYCVTHAESPTRCSNAGNGSVSFTYYSGRWFERGMVDTQEKCEIGLCNHNEWLTAEECAQYSFCTWGCQGCTRDWWVEGEDWVCTHTNETLCDEDNDTWDESLELCIASSVTSRGECDGTVAECTDYDEDECSSNGLVSGGYLACRYDWRQCLDEAECLEQGECSDWDLATWNNWENQNAGVCMMPKEMAEWGEPTCDQYMRFGGFGGGMDGFDDFDDGNFTDDGNHTDFGDDMMGDDMTGDDMGGDMGMPPMRRRREAYTTVVDGHRRTRSGRRVPVSTMTRYKAAAGILSAQNRRDVDEEADYGMVRWTPEGCIVEGDFDTQETCEDGGGVWTYRAETRSECLAKESCCTGRNCPWSNVNRDQEECEACGGEIQTIYNWHGGQWQGGAVTPLTWKQREWASRNSVAITVNEDKMRRFIEDAIATLISHAVRKRMKCENNGVLAILETVACECGVNTNDACTTTETGPVDLADESIYCGEAQTVEAGDFALGVGADSVADCSVETSINLGALSTPKREADTETSRRRRAADDLDEVPCYVNIENSNGLNIAQHRGDCIVYESAGSALNNVEICLSIDESIPHDNSVYVEEIVAQQQSDGTTYVALTVDVTSTGNLRCFTTSASGTYCPASAISGWESATTFDGGACPQSAEATAVVAAQVAQAGGATGLAFTSQPSSGEQVAETWADTVQVSFVDDDGNTVTGATGTITLSVLDGTAPTGVALSGTVRTTATNGVATFNNLSVNKAASAMQLKAAAPGVSTTGTSAAFTVLPGDPAALSFISQPAGVVDNEVFLQQPVVAVVDAEGNIVTTDDSTSVTLTADETSGTVSGTLTQTVVDGLATFTDLKHDVATTPVTANTLIAAANGLTSVTSDNYIVQGASGFAVRLTITSGGSPSDVTEGLAIPNVVVQVQDFNGDIVNTSTASITMAIKDNTGHPNAILSSDALTVAAEAGVATFSGLSIDQVEDDYQLQFTSASLASAETAAFDVEIPTIQFSSLGISTVLSGDAIPDFTITMKDRDGNVMTGRNDYLTIGFDDGQNGDSGVDFNSDSVVRKRLSQGVATFSGIRLESENTVNGLTLEAVSDNGSTASSDAFAVTGSGAQNTDDPDDDDDSGSSTDVLAIALGVCGGAVFVAAVVGGVYTYKAKQRKQRVNAAKEYHPEPATREVPSL